MPYFIYFLKSEEGYHYIGYTPDLDRRLSEHNAHTTHSTNTHGHNWKIIYTEEFSTRSEAMKRERWLKSGVGREWAKKNIKRWSPPKVE
jgi:putative endonuclease